MMRLFFAGVFLLFQFLHSEAQPISIATARSQSIGNTVTIQGIATTGAEFGTIRYLQDSTAGIAVYSSQLSSVARGDFIEVTGVLKDYNGLLELDPVTNLIFISGGNPIPPPKVISIPGGFSNANEGQLVRVNSVSFASSGNFSTSSTNYTISNGSNNAEVRIMSTTNIGGTPIPGGNINLIGILGEYNGTFQLQPRALNDMLESGPKFITPLIQSNISQFGFDVSFNTEFPGSTTIRYGKTASLGTVLSSATLDTAHFAQLSGLDHGSIYYLKAFSIDINNDTSWSGLQLMATASLSPGIIKVYFNRPVNQSVQSGTPAVYLNQTMDDTLIALLNSAQNTLDIAIYNLDNQNNIIDAINAAYQRGVLVRVITDDGVSATNYNAINIGIGFKKKSPVGAAPSGGFYGIMHNKFVVVDANNANPNTPWVWTGSTNFTTGQILTDPNNSIAIQDQALARAYTIEFEEMWSGKFGPEKTDNTPHLFKIGGRTVELFFSPSDNTEEKIKSTIRTADYDLYFALFAWTRYNIAYDIEDRINHGVFAAGIMNDTSGDNNLPYNVLIDDMPNTLFLWDLPGLLHHKYLIVDPNDAGSDPITLTGSHNWSSSANTRNDENTLIIQDASIANQYYQEWLQRYEDVGGKQLVGINAENPAPFNFMVYPNPNAGLMYFALQGMDKGKMQISIIDIAGRTVFVKKLNESDVPAINLGALSNGLYLVQVSNGNQTGNAKILISK